MRRQIGVLLRALTGRRPRRDRRGICPPMGTGWNFALRRRMRQGLGIDVHRVRPSGAQRITKSTLLFELDDSFTNVVAEGVARSKSGPTGEGDGPVRHVQRLYNLAQMVDFTAGVDGLVVECGCYRGLSAYVVCCYLRAQSPQFDGGSFHIFDSFEGISAPTSEDGIGDPGIPIGKTKRAAGMFAAVEDDVRKVLAEFPAVSFHRGWIPESFAGIPPAAYRLVHVDLDVHAPTKAAMEFFYPQLSVGGVLVCDDFGSVRWPGAREAVESFCAETGARLFRMSSGQALITRPPGR